jgi:hypothetical protein
MLSGYQLVIRKKDQGERGVFYGEQVGPLLRDEANQLCSQSPFLRLMRSASIYSA